MTRNTTGGDLLSAKEDTRRARLRGSAGGGLFLRTVQRYCRQGLPVAGLVWIFLVLVVAVTGGALAPFNPLAQNLSQTLQGPSAQHLLGTDQLGRDVLSRLIAGTRPSVLIAAEATAVSAGVGVLVGLLVGYTGGLWDKVVMRVVDAMMAIPGLVLALAILGVFGNDLTVAMAGVGLAFAPFFVRLVRASVLSVRESLYIEAAHVGRLPKWRVLVNHVLPNIMPPLIVQTAVTFGRTLLIAAALNFIGLGVQPPFPSWGVMIADSAALISRQPFLVVPPGLAIGLTVLASNFIADGLRDALSVSQVRRRHSHQKKSLAHMHAPVAVSSTTIGSNILAGEVKNALLLVEGLTVAFPSPTGSMCPIVDSLAFAVATGEIMGVVGESGSGKTMTALAIVGLTPVPCRITAGSILFAGTNLVKLEERKLNEVRGRGIGMVFQEPMAALHPTIRIGYQVAEPLRYHLGMSRARAQLRMLELLEMAEVPDPVRVARAYAHELSGGLAQRVIIAMALACQPSLLIADEATTALDVTVQAEILDLLRRLRIELNLTVLFVSHDLRVIGDLCDRVVVMYAGEVVESSSVAELFGPGPHHPYTQGLLASLSRERDSFDHVAPVLFGSVPAPGAWPSGCRFAPRCSLVEERCRRDPPILRPAGDRLEIRCIRTNTELTQTAVVGGDHGGETRR